MRLAEWSRMFHHTFRSRPHALLFTDWEEAEYLWTALVGAAPGLAAACLMPDHGHLLHPTRDLRRRLGAVLSGYIQWRNHRRGSSGPVLRPIDVGHPIPGELKRRRNVRYVHLNPCRAGLVTDPLAWPFSTHRDATGLVVVPVRSVHPDPARFHEYVSMDDQAATCGLPGGAMQASLEQVWGATSAGLRVPESAMCRRGPARSLFLQSARALTEASIREIAAFAQVGPATVARSDAQRTSAVRVVERLLGDPRFPALHDGDLRELPTWRRYRNRD